MIAVIALAVSTWILSSPAHRPTTEAAAHPLQLPGYYIKNAVLTDFDAAGAPSMRLEAARIDQIGHGVEVSLTRVTVHYQGPNGQTWVLTGDTAHVEPGAHIIDVAGHVRLQGEGSDLARNEVVLSDTLRYDVPLAVVSTHSDVSVEFGIQTLTARGLVANLKTRTIHLDQKVNGRFER